MSANAPVFRILYINIYFVINVYCLRSTVYVNIYHVKKKTLMDYIQGFSIDFHINLRITCSQPFCEIVVFKNFKKIVKVLVTNFCFNIASHFRVCNIDSYCCKALYLKCLQEFWYICSYFLRHLQQLCTWKKEQPFYNNRSWKDSSSGGKPEYAITT